MWLINNSCDSAVNNVWNENVNGSSTYLLASKLRNIYFSLSRWNKETFGNVHNKILDLQQRLATLQNNVGKSSEVREKIHIRSMLEHLLDCEETLWAQKARQLWLIQGDRNTKYFHVVVNKRRIHNRITQIRGSNGAWIEDYIIFK